MKKGSLLLLIALFLGGQAFAVASFDKEILKKEQPPKEVITTARFKGFVLKVSHATKEYLSFQNNLTSVVYDGIGIEEFVDYAGGEQWIKEKDTIEAILRLNTEVFKGKYHFEIYREDGQEFDRFPAIGLAYKADILILKDNDLAI